MGHDGDGDYVWERLLQAIESGKVVPIIGRDALQVETPTGLRRYDQVVAERLAASIGVDAAALPGDFDLNDVVCRAANFRGITPGSYNARIISILQSIKVETPQALRCLARIPKFRLFVSLTFDTLLEQALAEARGRAPAVASFPAATDQVDFDQSLIDAHGTMVFQLLGRRSASAQFAVTEGQVLELLHRVMSSDNRPVRLIDKLRDSHLLMVGTGLPDWPTRFLLRMARPGPLWNDRDTDEIVADCAHEGLPTFLHRFSPEHSLTCGSTPLAFARELERRWFERFPEAACAQAVHGDGDDDPRRPGMTPGSVFISYAHEDRAAAYTLADRLNDADIDVWIDRQLKPADAYRSLIRNHIVNAGAFVALLSSATRNRVPGYYRLEWEIASEQNGHYLATDRNYIFPVIVDGSAARDHALALNQFSSRGVQASRAAGGDPDDALVQGLNQAQRQWRKDHGTRA